MDKVSYPQYNSTIQVREMAVRTQLCTEVLFYSQYTSTIQVGDMALKTQAWAEIVIYTVHYYNTG